MEAGAAGGAALEIAEQVESVDGVAHPLLRVAEESVVGCPRFLAPLDGGAVGKHRDARTVGVMQRDDDEAAAGEVGEQRRAAETGGAKAVREEHHREPPAPGCRRTVAAGGDPHAGGEVGRQLLGHRSRSDRVHVGDRNAGRGACRVPELDDEAARVFRCVGEGLGAPRRRHLQGQGADRIRAGRGRQRRRGDGSGARDLWAAGAARGGKGKRRGERHDDGAPASLPLERPLDLHAMHAA